MDGLVAISKDSGIDPNLFEGVKFFPLQEGIKTITWTRGHPRGVGLLGRGQRAPFLPLPTSYMVWGAL